MSHGRIRRPEGGANLYSLPTSFIAVDTEETGRDFNLFIGNAIRLVCNVTSDMDVLYRGSGYALGEPLKYEYVDRPWSSVKRAKSVGAESFLTYPRPLKLSIKENFLHRIAGYGIRENGNRLAPKCEI